MSWNTLCKNNYLKEGIQKKTIFFLKIAVIGFGDYSQQHGLVKNHPTTPILKLKKELKRFCDVVDIDEWGWLTVD